jgi:hypothetical protein
MCDKVLELLHVEPIGASGVEAHLVPLDEEVWSKGMAQDGERVAQVISGFVSSQLSPEELGKDLTGMAALPIDHKISEEGFDLASRQLREGPIAAPDLKTP